MDSGFIYSPGYPNEVIREDNCVWVFYATSGLRPSLEIVRSEVNHSCVFVYTKSPISKQGD